MAEPIDLGDQEDPVSDKPDEEGPLESAFLPGAVTTVWSDILSTAFRRLQEGR
ncbi:hypothetical protein ABZ926_02635 [Streptomyces litmocidini]|uniref:hypothetical protein n=1 Tax=Streptomyces litmocidini TaxID=67318 RepID=UPI0033EEC8EC